MNATIFGRRSSTIAPVPPIRSEGCRTCKATQRVGDDEAQARAQHPKTWLRGYSFATPRAIAGPNLSTQLRSFVGEVEATLGKQLLDIAIAQGEAKVQPHGVLDDDRRKTMPAIGDQGHARSLRRTPPIQQAVFLTVPPLDLADPVHDVGIPGADARLHIPMLPSLRIAFKDREGQRSRNSRTLVQLRHSGGNACRLTSGACTLSIELQKR